MLTVKKISLGFLATNFYLATNSEGITFAVDPAIYDATLENFLKENQVEKLEYILLTHGHFDHICGAKQLQEKFGGKIVISKIDEECFSDTTLSLAKDFFLPSPAPDKADITVCEGSVLPFGDCEIKVMHTPGHTRGSVCYLTEDFIFTGDTLFAGTVGRTDFPGGSMQEILCSVKRLAALDGDFQLLPGHNETTTLEFERHNNVYCR